MTEHVIIDGNNLLFAMHSHAPMPLVGRETMVKVIERWARKGSADVTLVFDGAPPRGGLSKQMSSSRIAVRFSAPVPADDTIVEFIHGAKDPASVRVVTGDKAISYEARRRRCRHTSAIDFVAELFPPPGKTQPSPSPTSEKPEHVTPEEAKELLDLFGGDTECDSDPSQSNDGWDETFGAR